jgi:hypothetical protein
MTNTLEDTLARHVHHLAAVIGARPVGTAANRAAGDYVAAEFRRVGLEIEEQPFACTTWENASTALEVEGEKAPAAANAFSLPCAVSGPLVVLSTEAELEAAELTGQIGLLCGELVSPHPCQRAGSWPPTVTAASSSCLSPKDPWRRSPSRTGWASWSAFWKTPTSTSLQPPSTPSPA